MPAKKNTVSNYPDNEYWCSMRSGSDYPQSLQKPYPANYVPPPVFMADTANSASAHTTTSLVAAVLVCMVIAIATLF